MVRASSWVISCAEQAIAWAAKEEKYPVREHRGVATHVDRCELVMRLWGFALLAAAATGWGRALAREK